MADLSGLTWDELLVHGAWLEKEADESAEPEVGLGVEPTLMGWYLDYCDEIDRREAVQDAWRYR